MEGAGGIFVVGGGDLNLEEEIDHGVEKPFVPGLTLAGKPFGDHEVWVKFCKLFFGT